MRVAAGDADWLSEAAERASEGEALLEMLGAGVPVSFCTGVRGFLEAEGRTSEAEGLLALLGAVVVLWVEFPEIGAVLLFAFGAGVPVSLCAELRKFSGAAGGTSEVEVLLALLGAGVPVSLWRLSEDARRGVRSGEAAPEFVPASAVLDAAERKLEKAGELPRFAATRRAEASGASDLWGARTAFAFCSACVSVFF